MDENLPRKRDREDDPPPSRSRRTRVPVLKKLHSIHDLVPLIAASSSMPMVSISSDAMCTMSFHSHLCTDEVIGWMAGKISEDLIEIKQAFPVGALQHENGRINVEMDAEDAVLKRTLIEEKGLSLVGWYHSHPTFEVNPSLVDIDNQLNYQGISDGHFLGGIVSPYYSPNRLEGTFTVFCVKKNNDENKRNGYHPAYSVRFSVGNEDVSSECVGDLAQLVKSYKTHKRFIQVGKKWKKGMTNLEKIGKALENFRLKKEELEMILGVFKE
jgi:proteasome lid subunit RPN8/RPN11